MSQKSVEYHVCKGDYFGTLATGLSLVRQTVKDDKFKQIGIKTLNRIEKDLMFLQKEYKIAKINYKR